MIDKIKKYYQDPLVNFIVKILFVFGCWKVLLKASQVVIPFKEKWEVMMAFFLNLVTSIAVIIMKVFNYDVVHEGAYLAIRNCYGVVVGPACVGIGLMFTYSGLILAYKGPRKLQFWFVFGGLFALNFLNGLRAAILCIVASINQEWVEFNHKYVFNNILYIFVLAIWIWYVNLSNKAAKNTVEN